MVEMGREAREVNGARKARLDLVSLAGKTPTRISLRYRSRLTAEKPRRCVSGECSKLSTTQPAPTPTRRSTLRLRPAGGPARPKRIAFAEGFRRAEGSTMPA
jgi:hypothetical protein